MSPNGETEPAAGETAVAAPRQQSVHRLALVATVVLLIIVVVTLPFAIRSMAATLFSGQQATLYDLVNGGEVPLVVAAATTLDHSYVNIAVVGLDPVTGQATLAVSGNRVCASACPRVALSLLALDDNATQRRGLPPRPRSPLSQRIGSSASQSRCPCVAGPVFTRSTPTSSGWDLPSS